MRGVPFGLLSAEYVMPPVKWTRTHRKKLHGFRAPHKSDPKDVAVSGDDAWSAMVASGRVAKVNPYIDAIGEDEQSAAVIASIWAELDSGVRPERLDPARECHRVIVTCLEDLTLASGDYARFQKWEAWAPYRLLVSFWMSFGVETAVEILAAPIPYSSGGRSSSTRKSVNLTTLAPDAPGVTHGSSFMQHEPLWWALRCLLSTLSDADFAAALQEAAPHYERLKSSEEVNAKSNLTFLAFAFSRDGAWLRELAQRAAGGDETVEHTVLLLAGLTDSALALRCIEQRPWSYTAYRAQYYAQDMIESLGPAGAISVLERLCEIQGVKARYKKKLQSPIKLARTGL